MNLATGDVTVTTTPHSNRNVSYHRTREPQANEGSAFCCCREIVSLFSSGLSRGFWPAPVGPETRG